MSLISPCMVIWIYNDTSLNQILLYIGIYFFALQSSNSKRIDLSWCYDWNIQLELLYLLCSCHTDSSWKDISKKIAMLITEHTPKIFGYSKEKYNFFCTSGSSYISAIMQIDKIKISFELIYKLFNCLTWARINQN